MENPAEETFRYPNQNLFRAQRAVPTCNRTAVDAKALGMIFHSGSPLFSVESELREAEFAGDEIKHGDHVSGGAVATGFAFGGTEPELRD